VSVGMIVLGLASSLITNILGFLYPAYKSIQAMNTDGMGDDKQWLTYWIVFSLFSVIDNNFEFILELIPFFHLIKLLFLFYLFHPGYNGAEKVYNIVSFNCNNLV
jgi:receptor expression-enhancing protein 5/6